MSQNLLFYAQDKAGFILLYFVKYYLFFGAPVGYYSQFALIGNYTEW